MHTAEPGPRPSTAAVAATVKEECKVTYWAGGSGRVRVKSFEPVASTIWSVTGRSFGEIFLMNNQIRGADQCALGALLT